MQIVAENPQGLAYHTWIKNLEIARVLCDGRHGIHHRFSKINNPTFGFMEKVDPNMIEVDDHNPARVGDTANTHIADVAVRLRQSRKVPYLP